MSSQLLRALIVLVFSFELMAGEVSNVKKISARQLPDSLIGRYMLNLEQKLEENIKAYNQLIKDRKFSEKVLLNMDSEENKTFISALLKDKPALKMPPMKWVKNTYMMNFEKHTISISPTDILMNQVMINGKAFHIDPQKNMGQLHDELMSFFKQNKMVNVQSMLNIPFEFIFPEAHAVGFIAVAIVVLLLIATLGVAFYLKSAMDKKAALISALRQTHEDFNQRAAKCENAKDNEESYQATFDLMSGVLRERVEETTAGVFYSNMLRPEQTTANNCTETINQFIQKSIGSSDMASNTSELGRLRMQLCGGVGSASILADDAGAGPGSYNRMRNCLEQFHNTHVQITNGDRNSIWIDQDVGLIENRNHYNRAVGR